KTCTHLQSIFNGKLIQLREELKKIQEKQASLRPPLLVFLADFKGSDLFSSLKRKAKESDSLKKRLNEFLTMQSQYNLIDNKTWPDMAGLQAYQDKLIRESGDLAILIQQAELYSYDYDKLKIRMNHDINGEISNI